MLNSMLEAYSLLHQQRPEIIVVFIYLFGGAIGSFLNVVIYRVPRAESILGRSKCPNCQTQLTALQNIPVFSYVFLTGSCAYCHTSISTRYPITELVIMYLFGAVYLIWHPVFPMTAFVSIILTYVSIGWSLQLLTLDSETVVKLKS